MSKLRSNQLTKKQANDLFIYDNGKLYWKNPGPHRQMNKPVGTVNGNYNRVGLRIDGVLKCFQLHNIIYNLHYGKIKRGVEVDHWNRNSFDNRIENLRLLTHKENCNNNGY